MCVSPHHLLDLVNHIVINDRWIITLSCTLYIQLSRRVSTARI